MQQTLMWQEGAENSHGDKINFDEKCYKHTLFKTFT